MIYRLSTFYFLFFIFFLALDPCQAAKKTNNDDLNPPVANCESFRQASLASDGYAKIDAIAFDDGSNNGGSPVYFKARRQVLGQCDQLNGDDSSIGGYQEYYDDYVKFCCEDIGTPVNVILRVFSVNPGLGPISPSAYAGYWSECWSEVTVEDKLPPEIICPADITVSCSENILIIDLQNNSLDNPYGYAIGYDNCDVSITVTASEPQGCGANVERFYTRIFTARDPDGRIARCTQRIYLEEDPFKICDVQARCTPVSSSCNSPHSRQDNVEWPCDLYLNLCAGDADPWDLNLMSGTDVNGQNIALNAYPRYDNAGVLNDEILGVYPYACAQIALDSADQIYTLEEGACLKIIRTWTVIDWCQFDAVTRDPDDPNRFLGYWEYIQIIKLSDAAAPVFNDFGDTDFCDDATTDCLVSVSMTASATDNCTAEDQLHYSWTVDYFSDGAIDLTGSGHMFNRSVEQTHPDGLDEAGAPHRIRWRVEDGCGNETIEEYTFTAVECKNPTPYCDNGVATVVMPTSGCITIWANDLDAGSFDNCTANEDLIFSVRIAGSTDLLQTSIELCCEDISNGIEETIALEFWVEDQAGNQDNCISYVLLQDTPDTDMPEGICPDMLCEITGYAATDIDCYDNGTSTDPLDDTFSFIVNVSGESNSNNWVANDPNSTIGNYNTDVSFGPYPIQGDTIRFTLVDTEDNECSIDIAVAIPPTCSEDCILTHVISDISCNDNGTPTTPNDDTYTFTGSVEAVNTMGTWTANDPNNTSGAYNTDVVFGSYPISAGSLNFDITSDFRDCSTTVDVTAPVTCSDECILSHVISDIVCNDNGTPTNPNDDTYTFTGSVEAVNTMGTWTANDPNNTSGAYNTDVVFGPYPISAGSLNFDITSDFRDCSTTVDVTAPRTCSDECILSHVISDIVCNDNDTPANPNDDTYTFTGSVEAVNTMGTWTANDPNNTSGAYNTDVVFGPYPISAGSLNFDITSDFRDCSTTVDVTAPATCSDECIVNSTVTNLSCLDNDSPANPDDDTFTFDVELNGSQTGSSWTANDVNSTTGSYNTVVTFGPYPISGGVLNITITSDQNIDCVTDINVTPPEACSEEMLCTTIYGLTTNSELYGINTMTGAISFIQTGSVSNTNALAINDELGLAYFAAGLTVYWMEIGTGVVGEVGTISIPGSLSNGAGAFSMGNLYVGTEVPTVTGNEEVEDIFRLTVSADGKSFTTGPINISNGIIPNDQNFGDFVIENGTQGNETIIISSLDNSTRINTIKRLDVAAQTIVDLSSGFGGNSTAQITRDNEGTWWIFENAFQDLSNFNINTGQTTNTVYVGFSFADLGRAWCAGNMNMRPKLSGSLRTTYNLPVVNHTIQILNHDSEILGSGLSTGNGDYGFMQVDNNQFIRPYKNDDTPNGINTLDLIKIKRHLLGIETIDNPYDMIAADANNSEGINVLDILELQQVILGIRSEFVRNTSWRYVQKDEQMDQENPYDFEELRLVEDCTAIDPCVADYIAVKVGDVNGTAYTFPDPKEDLELRSGLRLLVNKNNIEIQNDLIRIPITSDNFDDIQGYQFTLSFDAGQMQFVHIESGALNIFKENISSIIAQAGYVTTNWFDAIAQSRSSDEVLFTIVFKGNRMSALLLNNDITKAESYINGQARSISLNIGASSKPFALHQNRPNPFTEHSIIAFDMPSDQQVTLRIMDVNGRLLSKQYIQATKGRNEYMLRSADPQKLTGVFYYQVSFDKFSATKKMVVLK